MTRRVIEAIVGFSGGRSKRRSLAAVALVCAVLVPAAAWSQTNIFPASGNAGIGTTNPVDALQLGPASGSSSTHYQFALDGFDNNTPYPSILFNNAGNLSMGIGVDPNGDLQFGLANGSGTTWDFPTAYPSLTIFQTRGGNVGIGSNDAWKTLQVGPNADSQTPYQLFLGGYSTRG